MSGRAWPKRAKPRWTPIKKTTDAAGNVTTTGQWKRPMYFQRTVINAFQTYIAESALPTADRLLLATMVARIAPRFNPRFDIEQFFDGCGLDAKGEF